MSEAAARRNLFDAAKAYARAEDVESAFALVDAARVFASTAPAVSAPTATPPDTAPSIAFGAAKGTPLREATPKNLEWYEHALVESLADPSKSKWKARNKALLGQARAELARRRGAP